MSKFKEKLINIKSVKSIVANENEQVINDNPINEPIIDEPIINEPEVQKEEENNDQTEEFINDEHHDKVQEEEQIQEDQSLDEVQEEIEESKEEYTDEDAEKEELREYGDDYKDIHGQITPWHVLFKDLSNDIASLDDNGAIDYVVNFLHEYNEDYKNDDRYLKVEDSHIDYLKDQLHENEEVNSGMDVLFEIKEKLLESEGLKKNSSRLKKTKRG